MAKNALILPQDIPLLDGTKFNPDDKFEAYKSIANGNCFYDSITQLTGGEPTLVYLIRVSPLINELPPTKFHVQYTSLLLINELPIKGVLQTSQYMHCKKGGAHLNGPKCF